MAIRTILRYPDPRLRIKAEPVAVVDDAIRALCDDMAETMYAAPGVGLAAPQIGVSKRIFVIDTASGEDDQPSQLRYFINPEFITREGECVWEEGCLSFPGIHAEIERAERVTVRALGLDGQPFELSADGLLAIAIQHENDHLEGKLMVDRVSLLKKRMIDREMRKRQLTDARP
ncbi:MAG: peptide deformylase [Polyangiales bacterium]